MRLESNHSRLMTLRLLFISIALFFFFHNTCFCGEWSAKKSKKTLKILKQHVENGYFDPKGPPDWDEIWQEYIEPLSNVEDKLTFYIQLNDALSKTKVSHFSVFPREIRNYPAILYQLNVVKLDDAAFTGSTDIVCEPEIVPGSEIIEINNKKYRDYLNHYFYNDEVLPQNMLLERDDGSRYFVDLQEYQKEIKKKSFITTQWLTDNIAYVSLDTFYEEYYADKVNRELKEVKHAKGIIIDLRRNRGGIMPNVLHFMSHFTDNQIQLGKWFVSRSQSELKSMFAYLYRYFADRPFKIRDRSKIGIPQPGSLKVSPGLHPYKGKVVVLVGPSTASAAEITARGFQILKGGLLVGRKTMGAVYASMSLWMPYDGRMQLPVWGFIDSNNKMLEGNRVSPNVEIEISREDLVLKKDIELDTALLLIKDMVMESEK